MEFNVSLTISVIGQGSNILTLSTCKNDLEIWKCHICKVDDSALKLFIRSIGHGVACKIVKMSYQTVSRDKFEILSEGCSSMKCSVHHTYDVIRQRYHNTQYNVVCAGAMHRIDITYHSFAFSLK